MLYDYYGFPAEAYRVNWPAPGDPPLAAQVRERLIAAGFKSNMDDKRGFDHGAFVVTAVAYPHAAVPTFQLSLKRGLDPSEHLALGRALLPFRDEGVFIIGSGMSYHNLPRFMDFARGNNAPDIEATSKDFDDWLHDTVTLDAASREKRLVAWEKAPAARACHPREEHLLPLMVIAGAAGEDAGTVPYRDVIYGAHTLAAQFG
jgi:aromatic ring-opening dioxygenase catalytic subunit (LigB family)